MCRSKTDPRGPWRCTPNQATLDQYRGHHDAEVFNQAHGAFWLEDSVPTMADIKFLQRDTLSRWESGSLDVEDVIHLGKHISAYADSKVYNLHNRLAFSQEQALEFNEMFLNSNGQESSHQRKQMNAIYIRSINDSLSLGAEMQTSIKDTLSEVRSFNGFMPVFSGDTFPEHENVALMAGNIYPEQWKTAIADNPVKLYVSEGTGAYYSVNTIVVGKDLADTAESSYRSLAEVAEGKKKDPLVHQYLGAYAHEMGHKFEDVSPTLKAICYNFQHRRGLKDSNGQLLTSYMGEGDNDLRIMDHFTSDYVGKYYESSDGGTPKTEVFSTGIESIFLGNYGSLVGRPEPIHEHPRRIMFRRADTEHRDLVLGLLAFLEI